MKGLRISKSRKRILGMMLFGVFMILPGVMVFTGMNPLSTDVNYIVKELRKDQGFDIAALGDPALFGRVVDLEFHRDEAEILVYSDKESSLDELKADVVGWARGIGITGTPHFETRTRQKSNAVAATYEWSGSWTGDDFRVNWSGRDIASGLPTGSLAKYKYGLVTASWPMKGTYNGNEELDTKGMTALTIKEFLKLESVSVSYHRPAWFWPLYGAMVGFAWIILGVCAWLAVKAIKAPPEVIIELEKPKSHKPPLAVQESYDSAKPWWKSGSPLVSAGLLPVLPVFLMVPLLSSFEDHIVMTGLNPFLVMGAWMGPVLACPFVGFIFPAWVRVWRRKDPAEDAIESDFGKADIDDYDLRIERNQTLLQVGFFWQVAPAGVWLFLMVLGMRVGLLTKLPSALVRPMLLGGLVVCMAVGYFVSWRKGQRAKEFFPAGHWVDTAAKDFAGKVNIRLRKVELKRMAVANAWAGLFGSTGVTSALMRRLGPDEVKAVVAHEIGHHKGRHVAKHLVMGLGLILAVNAAWWKTTDWLETFPWYEHLSIITMLGFYASAGLMPLVLSPAKRKAEREADQFAVEATQNPDLVIRALSKVAFSNQSPMRLKEKHERVSSHPSLVNRIRHIREVAKTLNLPVTLDESNVVEQVWPELEVVLDQEREALLRDANHDDAGSSPSPS